MNKKRAASLAEQAWCACWARVRFSVHKVDSIYFLIDLTFIAAQTNAGYKSAEWFGAVGRNAVLDHDWSIVGLRSATRRAASKEVPSGPKS